MPVIDVQVHPFDRSHPGRAVGQPLARTRQRYGSGTAEDRVLQHHFVFSCLRGRHDCAGPSARRRRATVDARLRLLYLSRITSATTTQMTLASRICVGDGRGIPRVLIVSDATADRGPADDARALLISGFRQPSAAPSEMGEGGCNPSVEPKSAATAAAARALALADYVGGGGSGARVADSSDDTGAARLNELP